MSSITKRLDYKGAYNTIKREKFGQFVDSLFAEQYRKASIVVSEIVEKSFSESGNLCKKVNVMCEDKEPEVYNVISFLGGRGTGKTSAMVSYIDFLENYEYYLENNSCEKSRKFFLHIPACREVSFLKLDMINATMFGKNEGILDVILANMWEFYKNKVQEKCYYRGDFSEKKENIAKEFSALKRAYQDYLQMSEHKTTSEIRQLSELACSLNFRKQFQDFVQRFLDVFGNGTSKFLILMIDDIDMAGKNSFAIMEQIHLFLNVPNVIIFITADISRLQQICGHYYYETYVVGENLDAGLAYDRSIVTYKQAFANDYLEKIIALDMRIYMPDFYMLNPFLKENKTEEEKDIKLNADNIDNETKAFGNIRLKNKILHRLYHQKLEFDGNAEEHHFLESVTLRGNVALLHELDRGSEMGEDESEHIIHWLQQRIQDQLLSRIESAYSREKINGIFHVDDQYINEYFIQLIDSELNEINYLEENIYNIHAEQKLKKVYWRESEVYGYRLSEVLYGCALLQQQDYRYKSMVDVVIAYYTVKIAQLKEKGESDKIENIFRNSIWGVWTNNMLKGMRNRIINYGTEGRLGGVYYDRFGIRMQLRKEEIEKELSGILDEEGNLKADAMVQFIDKVVNQNQKQVYAYQILLAFINISDIEDGDFKVSYEVGDSEVIEMPRPTKGDGGFDISHSEDKKQVGQGVNTDSVGEKLENPHTYIIQILGDFEVSDFNFDYLFMNVDVLLKICEKFKKVFFCLLLKCLCEIIVSILKEQNRDKEIVYSEKEIVSKCLKQSDDKLRESKKSELFLVDSIDVWKGKNSQKIVFPYQNIEMIYTIGKKLEHKTKIFQTERFYIDLRKLYQMIQKELEERDKFYNTINSDEGYCKPFTEYPVVKFFLDNPYSQETQMMLKSLVQPEKIDSVLID